MRSILPETARRWAPFAVSGLAGLLLTSLTTVAAPPAPTYNRDIRPLLADNCFRCHGPAVKKAGLRLDVREAALSPTEGGAVAIVPGKPAESDLIARINATSPAEVMPPPASRRTLSAEQKDLLTRWVASGAAYQKHWAFETPVKPPVPRVDGAGYRVVNPIDAFIADRLRRDGLTMAPEADRPTLARRAAFALTGLPPTPQEVDAYVSDTSARAYENLVERYLHSPRYGEEMARHWLDVARYADTHGLHLDNERQMWLYRDWVVRSFNDNLPFDQFTTDQIAGDLLPSPTPDQLVATGFNRCNVTTGEGGSIEQEWVFRNAIDRTTTMAETWLGVTAGCAVCHDHKYDPLPAKELYALYSFFYSAAGPPLDSNVLLHEPSVKVPSPEQKARLAALEKDMATAREGLEKAYLGVADPAGPFDAWLKAGGGAAAKDLSAEVKTRLDQFKQGKLDAAGKAALRRHYVLHVDAATAPKFKPLIETVDRLTKERAALDAAIPGSFVFKEMEKPREAFAMLRGQYDKPGAKVEPDTFSALPPLRKADPKARATRLDLAHWLVSPEQPLTSRVTVNRFWQQLFGIGLVKTSYDLGSQGEPPSHPELLDWLAVSFRESGWDVRALVRLMVTSATFRQASQVSPELLKRDPENRLYARGPRIRLDAEQVRDNALYVSGLVDLTMGGVGVKPYQPPNIWEPVAFTGSNTGVYRQDHGASLYRRSLYTFLKRTAPAPFMTNFDAPSRETFCTRRERSNTPLQALQLMNDVQHVEAARALAERVMSEGGSSPRDRLTYAFRVVLARKPEASELAVLEGQWTKFLSRFQKDPDAAAKLTTFGESHPRAGLPVPELAAWTLVANTLLNLDETITRN